MNRVVVYKILFDFWVIFSVWVLVNDGEEKTRVHEDEHMNCISGNISVVEENTRETKLWQEKNTV